MSVNQTRNLIKCIPLEIKIVNKIDGNNIDMICEFINLVNAAYDYIKELEEKQKDHDYEIGDLEEQIRNLNENVNDLNETITELKDELSVITSNE